MGAGGVGVGIGATPIEFNRCKYNMSSGFLQMTNVIEADRRMYTKSAPAGGGGGGLGGSKGRATH